MQIKTGYLYHIKDEYFDVINDKHVLVNHEKGHSRPTYFTVRDKDILWFIPISSKVDKYESIIKKKIDKYGECSSIMIVTIANKRVAILIQNAFPILEKYIDHPHIVDGKPLKVISTLKNKILYNFKHLLELKNEGINLFFTDIDNIKEIMINELSSPDKNKIA